MPVAWMLPAIVGAPLVAAALAPLVHRAARGAAGWLLALAPLAALGWTVQLAWPAEPVSMSLTWLPMLGVEFALRLDGLAGLFCVLITGIGVLVLVYAGGYMGGDPEAGRLHAYLLAFMGAMLGVVLADDLISLFVFWELTSVTSFLLIGFRHESKDARDAALQALLVTGAGGLALLAGFVLLATIAAASGVPMAQAGRISTLAAARESIQSHALFAPALVLLFVGAFTKSAQFPFHFWLPGAMAAPTPVSAFLHSATMVKAGVYLLARLHPLCGDAALWQIVVTTFGAMTMVGAAAMAVGQHDLKRILAFTTCSVLGTLTMLLGLGTDAAIKAAVVFLAAHALYKAALFMVAGIVDHAAGTRDVTRLGGLARHMPITAAAALLAALSMAGAPPMFGFIGKELVLKAKLDIESLNAILTLLAVLANICTIAMALVVSIWPFFGRPRERLEHPHEAAPAMLLGPVLLAVAGVFVGVLPGLFDATLGSAAASAIAGRPLEMKLKLWHGLSPLALAALAISAVSIALGIWLYLRLAERIEHVAATSRALARLGPARLYELALALLLRGAAVLTRIVQSGMLRRYISITILFALLLVAPPIVRAFDPHFSVASRAHWVHELVLAGLMLGGGAVALLAGSRLAAVVSLGVTGLAVGVFFAFFSAPDLALTVILAETLTVVLFVLLLGRLPPLGDRRTPRQRMTDGAIALAAGAMMTLLVLATTAVVRPPHVASELARISATEAHGRNVVNVILVDFRALDTLGEITVVAVAGIGVFALLRGGAGRCRPVEGGGA